MSSLILYPINIESAPNWVIRSSFAKHFYPFEEYDWVNIAAKIGLEKTQKDFLVTLKEKRPDYCFMQLQNPINMSVPMVREMAQYTKIINWCGDVRQNQEWYDWFIAIGKEIHITLFSNETDVDVMRNAGVKADYLQVGFDNVWYKPGPAVNGWPEIVFCANNYGNFQLSRYRGDVALALKNEFGDRFKLYGRGWDSIGIKTESINNVLEAQAYNSCKIAISVSNFQYRRYYSDRLLRIMGCGAFPLSHEYENMHDDFTEGYNIVTFKSLTDVINKCHQYLANDADRSFVASNAMHTAHSRHTWDVRCEELINILGKQ